MTKAYDHSSPASGETLLLITVDTEEDNWLPTRVGPTVENIAQLPRFQAICDRLGARPTYFTTYQVLEHEWSRNVMIGLDRSGKAEVATHLHPWNTPPFPEPLTGRNSMLHNLPPDVQAAKLRTLTERLTEVLGSAPTSFRAGRFAIGSACVSALLESGYRVDSSVTPFWDWRSYDEGPDFRLSPIFPHLISGDNSGRQRGPRNSLLEVPISTGFSRAPFAFWSRVYNGLGRQPFRTLRARGLASRAGVVDKIMLSPETDTLENMLRLSRRLLESGAPHLNLIFHSSSLIPGLSPFTPTSAAVEGLLDNLERYVAGVAEMTTLRFATIGEAADRLAPSVFGNATLNVEEGIVGKKASVWAA